MIITQTKDYIEYLLQIRVASALGVGCVCVDLRQTPDTGSAYPWDSFEPPVKNNWAKQLWEALPDIIAL